MVKLSEQEIIRRNKIDEIRKITNPYPERFELTHELKDIAFLEDGTSNVKIAGRIVFMRVMGKMSFVSLRDFEGSAQISVKVDEIGAEAYQEFKKLYDLGDFVGAEGEIFTTQTGVKTLRVQKLSFLGKALKPLPEKFHGLTDPELKYRNRYVDLIMNEETRDRFKNRFELIRNIRKYLESYGYYEVETPILNNKASGAAARPFIAHHNALDQDVYLRIAPETYLKRAVVGGLNKVYEIARCFRNEGIDSTHLQDFTMMEVYQAYYNYEDNMKFIEKMLKTIIEETFNTMKFQLGDKEIDFSGNWPRVSFRELLIKYVDIDLDVYDNKEKLIEIIKLKNIELDSDVPLEHMGYGNIIDYLYKKVARPYMINPQYLVGHPVSLSPLARSSDSNKAITDRFQLVVNGAEIVNGFSELVDPIEQERRLNEQALLKAGGDQDAMDSDSDYIGAMEYGMPPISGWGMGIDRLMQILTNSDNIRDVIMFPLMKPIEGNENKKILNESSSKPLTKIDFSKVIIEPLFKDYIDFENFSKADFRVVKVKSCEEVPKSKKLLKFILNDGTGIERVILSGIKDYYVPNDLINKTLVAITNLPPKEIMGHESCGMLLSAVHENEDGEVLNLIMLDDNIPAGAKLY